MIIVEYQTTERKEGGSYNEPIRTPSYATPEAAGLDLHAALSNPVFLQPGKRMLVPTGVRVKIPSGYVGMVCSRSGLAFKKGVCVLNAPGIIDADYRGEIGVILANLGDDELKIEPDDRIAQLVITPVALAHLVVGNLDETQRGAGGFGSTGVS